MMNGPTANDLSSVHGLESTRNNVSTSKTLLVAALQWGHHASNSGYGRICPHLEPCDIIYFSPPQVGGRLARFLDLARFDTRIRMSAKSYVTTHVLYADSQAIMTPPARCRSRYVGTIHLPVSPLNRGDMSLKDAAVARRRRSILGNFAGLIVLASSEVDPAKAAFPRSQVQFIPHGIQLPETFPHFPREPSDIGALRISVVGSNYRDWDDLEVILRIVASSRPRWFVHLVGIPCRQVSRIPDAANISIAPRLDDASYYDLITRCDAMLLPLTFSTANNALLEAHALGTVSVCSDLPGIRDYSLSTTRLFRNPFEAIDHLDHLSATSQSDREALSVMTWAEAERFGWPAIAERTRAFYQTVTEGAASHMEAAG